MSAHKPIEHYWKKVGLTPTRQQQEAILHVDGPLFLTAGPGSGKTRVLLWRTVNLLAFQDLKPEEIFLGTFTEKAAFQLKEGLRSLLAMVSNETGRPFDISKMAIGTVHSICNNIIADRFFTDGVRKNSPKVFDALDQYLFIYNRNRWIELLNAGEFDSEEIAQRTINQFFGKGDRSSRHEAVTAIISIFNRFSEEHLNPKMVKTEDTVIQSVINMYARYLEMLSEQHPRIATVDLSILQLEAYRTIVNSKSGGSKFKHVIVDEYQDTNSIQEKIFFELAKGHKNLCVVGDDDQSLYRFRGATVENLVEFESRCKKLIGVKPHRIDLVKNFRSKKSIVETYNEFIQLADWKKSGKRKGYYRVNDKIIEPHSKDKLKSVAVTSYEKLPIVAHELAIFLKRLKSDGKITDYNQVAFLFPAMKGNAKVRELKKALEDEDIPVYAPRSSGFLEVDECKAMFGLFAQIIGRPPFNPSASGSMKQFQGWVGGCVSYAKDKILPNDKQLEAFIDEKKEELSTIVSDYEILQKHISRKRWSEENTVTLEMVAELARVTGLSKSAQAALNRHTLRYLIKIRMEQGKPVTLKYVVNRVTSVDWSVLDLFYRLCGFQHFKKMFDLAENGTDEGPICNLALLSSYIGRYLESFPAVITARGFMEYRMSKLFFNSYIYALYRLQESEYEDEDDPFPKGRVPFLTIHQSKGLEFPYVVIGSVYKREWGVSKNEEIIRELLGKEGEPLDRIGLYDNMRMFYVALSRAKNLLILPRYKGGSSATEEFKELFNQRTFPELKDIKTKDFPDAEPSQQELGKNYSFTGDFLQYQKCARQYMIFKQYGFVPSRSQTMFFGSLVHQTIEDLHNFLIHETPKNPIA